MRKTKGIVILLICMLYFCALHAQNGAQISTDVSLYNFGTIVESDGLVSHVFTVKNTGNAPLVITRITASCGCTQPEWSKEPVNPGKTGSVKITFDPKGRLGPFYKTISIYSNGQKGIHALAIRGAVTTKSIKPAYVYPYSIGDLQMTTKTILFSSVRPNETLSERINVVNNAQTSISLQLGKTPNYLKIEAASDTILPGETGEITFTIDGKLARRKGRITADIPVIVNSAEKKEVSGSVHVAVNFIDNFSKLSASEKVQAPVAELSNTLVEFGQITEKNSFIPLIGGRVSTTFEITNTGKSPLQIYSVTSDYEQLDISGGKKELRPGATAAFKVSIRPKDIKAKLEALINVVCNDPNGPVRLIKVTAHK